MSSSISVHWSVLLGRLRRFGRERDGSTAVEFALCVMPFLIITIGIIELMLMFFTVSAIEGAMDQATRMVRTGQMQDAGDPEQAFWAELCAHTIAVPCSEIRFEMVSGETVGEVSDIAPFWDNDDEGNGDIDIGETSSFVIARAAYDFHFITPLMGAMMGAGLDNEVPIRATAVARNEPF